MAGLQNRWMTGRCGEPTKLFALTGSNTDARQEHRDRAISHEAMQGDRSSGSKRRMRQHSASQSTLGDAPQTGRIQTRTAPAYSAGMCSIKNPKFNIRLFINLASQNSGCDYVNRASEMKTAPDDPQNVGSYFEL